jgi:hypothetical protein
MKIIIDSNIIFSALLTDVTQDQMHFPQISLIPIAIGIAEII